jgi:hypothetical protein
MHNTTTSSWNLVKTGPIKKKINKKNQTGKHKTVSVITKFTTALQNNLTKSFSLTSTNKKGIEKREREFRPTRDAKEFHGAPSSCTSTRWCSCLASQQCNAHQQLRAPCLRIARKRRDAREKFSVCCVGGIVESTMGST